MYEISESPLFLLLFGSFRQIHGRTVHNTAPQIQACDQDQTFSEGCIAEMCHTCVLYQWLISKTPVKASKFAFKSFGLQDGLFNSE